MKFVFSVLLVPITVIVTFPVVSAFFGDFIVPLDKWYIWVALGFLIGRIFSLVYDLWASPLVDFLSSKFCNIV